MTAPASAANGTWTSTASGNWGDSLNWSGGSVADGAGFTADFNSVDLPGDLTVTLDTPRTIGNLTFGDLDSTTTAGSWIVSGANTLTLDGTTPTITVNALGTGKVAQIASVVDGIAGLTKAGAGTLTLTGANLFSGGITVNGGALAFSSAAALGNAANAITLDGGTLRWQSNTTDVTAGRTLTIGAGGGTFDTNGNAVNLGSGSPSIVSGANTTFTKTGAGTLTLSNAQAGFTGGTVNVTGGQITLANAVNTIFGGATLNYSNGAAFRMGATSTSNSVGNNITLGAGGTATLLSAATANGYGGNITGPADAVINVSGNNAGQSFSFSNNTSVRQLANFLGTVNVANGNAIAFRASSGTVNNGGDNTTFELQGTANIFTRGAATVNLGALSSASATSALNASSNGGAITYVIGAKNIDTTYAGVVSSSANGINLTKVGSGTLVLNNAAIAHTGPTNVNAGVLKIDGTKSGAGVVNVNNTGTLAGTGSVAGLTTIASGGHLAAGGTTSVGTLSLATLTLNAGSIIDAEFNGGANDQINVTSGPLTINGGAVNLYNEGGTTPFVTDGTYNLIQYVGGISGTGISALSVGNPQSGTVYSFGDTGSFVTLAISSGGAPIYWNQSTGGTWGSAANWTAGGPPNAVGAFAGLGGGGTPLAAPASVTLDGNKTVGTVSFNSANAFTVAQGSGGSLQLDNASAPSAITNALGNHTISAPVSVNGAGANVNVVNAADSVTVSGSVSGPGAITNVGAGTVLLSGANTGYTGTASASAGKLVLGNANALVAGTLGGGAGTVGFSSNSTYNVAALGNGAITTVDAATISVGADNASTTFAGALAGPAGLTKAGSGTLTLAGSSSNSGLVTVEAGTLALRAGQTWAGGAVVNGGATLAMDVNSNVTGTVTLNNGATYNMASTTTTIFPNNTLALASGATATLTSAQLGHGFNGPVTGDAASTLLIGGQTSTSASGANQQFLNMLGTARVETGSTLRFGATSLNNGGPSTTFDILGTLTTRNGGAVALGAITGNGTLQGPNNAAGTATFTIGGNNASTTFAGPIVNGNAADRIAAITKTGAGTTTLTGPLSYTGATNVNGGTLVLGQSLTTSASVSTSNNALLELSSDGTATKVIKTGAVSITGTSRIDLKDNKLISTSSAGTASEGVYSGLQGQVQAAYNFGSWNGPGLTTSMQLALDGIATVGVATGEQIRGLGPTDTDVWAGQTINGASTIAMYTYAGDANLDGQVDAGDYGILDAFIQVEGATGYGNGDFNYDGFIDPADYGTIDNSIQFQGPPIFTSGGAGLASASSAGLSGVTAVPEPASLSIIGLAAAGMLRRRRRQE